MVEMRVLWCACGALGNIGDAGNVVPTASGSGRARLRSCANAILTAFLGSMLDSAFDAFFPSLGGRKMDFRSSPRSRDKSVRLPSILVEFFGVTM